MKFKDIKLIVNEMTDEELEKDACIVYGDFDLLYNSIDELKKAHEKFYYFNDRLVSETMIKKSKTIDMEECDLEIEEEDWYFIT